MNECIYCKSTDLIRDLPVVAREYIGSAQPAMVGPYYSVAQKKFLGQLQTHCKHEPMYADLCKQCGSVRYYVKNTDRDWQKKFPTAKDGMVFV